MNIAVISPAPQGHLNPMATLGRELARRGHRISLVSTPAAQPKADACGFQLLPFGVPEYQSGEIRALLDNLSRLKGLAALKFTSQLLHFQVRLTLRDVPEQLRAAGVQAAVVDQASPAGAVMADALRLPFVMGVTGQTLHQESGVPPGVLGWRYRSDFFSRLRNRFGNTVLMLATGPIVRTLSEFRRRNGFPRLRFDDFGELGLAQVTQQPAFFDYPRAELPTHFHYTGPWHELTRNTESVPFPWEKLDGRPLVYASLGTMLRHQHVFRAILDGCAELPLQVVLSLGKKDATWDGPVPLNAIVVPFAPQLKLLDRASLLITHSGMNTTLEGLACGLPMLCIPLANDEPGIARRVEWLGLGEMLKPGRVTAARVRMLVEKLLAGKYREAAQKRREQLKRLPGLVRAADIVEEAFRTGRRVERRDPCVVPLDAVCVNI